MGIVLFGEPGSGKSTVARFLGQNVIEVSRSLLPRLAALRRLPAHVHQMRLPRRSISLTREQARQLHARFVKKYGPAFIAEALARFYGHAVFTGVRGWANARWFQEHGYIAVYLTARRTTLVQRLMARGSSLQEARRELEGENHQYGTRRIKKLAHLVFDTDVMSAQDIALKIVYAQQECKKCVNTGMNPSIHFTKDGLCSVCDLYRKRFDRKKLIRELGFLQSLKRADKYDVMVGLSGGKDSTATLYTLQKMGFHPLAFAFDIGYYPLHIFSRAKAVAKQLHVDYEQIPIQQYIRPLDRRCYAKTADLYDWASPQKFRNNYENGRRHYSIKCRHVIPFVRTCQLCRRTVIRAYYAEAISHGVRIIVLGINEWAGLSKGHISAIRKLKPYRNKPAVSIVHLPFLLQRTIKQTAAILRKIGWKTPPHEQLVESNANSCLFARAAEVTAYRLLGFHPDATRLAREVTVGFITKKQAKAALAKAHYSRLSVRQILQPLLNKKA